jgi:hypothetical protein
MMPGYEELVVWHTKCALYFGLTIRLFSIQYILLFILVVERCIVSTCRNTMKTHGVFSHFIKQEQGTNMFFLYMDTRIFLINITHS